MIDFWLILNNAGLSKILTFQCPEFLTMSPKKSLSIKNNNLSCECTHRFPGETKTSPALSLSIFILMSA